MRIPKMWFRKQTGAWYVKIDGKQINLGKDKEKAHRQYRRLLDSGNPELHTVRQVLELHWQWLKKNRRPTTYQPREGMFRSFGESVPKYLKASSLRPYHVQKWIDDNPRPLSDTTKNYRITTICGVFNWAKKMGYLERNPVEGMPKPKRTVRQEFLPADRWRELLDAATDEEFKDWLSIMLATGARAEEMFKLKAEHFDGERFVLPIEDSKGRRESRIIYLPEPALYIVKRLADENPEGPLLLNKQGQPWNRNSVRCRFRRLKKVLNMPKLCATVLRHSYAHHRLTSGQDALTVAELLGHKGTDMLAKRYGKIGQNRGYMNGEANRIAFPSLPILDTPSIVPQ
jgi:integrase